MMRPLAELPRAEARRIETVFTDLDDTLTDDGRIGPEAFSALWRLRNAGRSVVIVTGRPAGWCDAIARLLPVRAVIGENGALAFAYDPGRRRMTRRYAGDGSTPASGRLDRVRDAVLRDVPGAAVAADQPFRMFDLAIDFAEDVDPLDDASVRRIRDIFVEHGATAKVSSIHVNGWFGSFDKLAMILRFGREDLGWDDRIPESAVYVGDSPNDEPAFAAFPMSVGVANVERFAAELASPPRYVTPSRGGRGFGELVDRMES